MNLSGVRKKCGDCRESAAPNLYRSVHSKAPGAVGLRTISQSKGVVPGE